MIRLHFELLSILVNGIKLIKTILGSKLGAFFSFSVHFCTQALPVIFNLLYLVVVLLQLLWSLPVYFLVLYLAIFLFEKIENMQSLFV